MSLTKIYSELSKEGFFLLIGRIISVVLMGVTSILIARYLEPENYGLYSIILFIPSFLIPISDLGISQSLLYFIAKNISSDKKIETSQIIMTGLLLKITSLFIITTLVIVFSVNISIFINRPYAYKLIQISSIFLFSSSLFETINYIFIGYKKAKISSVLIILQSMIRLLFTLIFIKYEFQVMGLLFVTGFGYFITSLIGICYIYIFFIRNIKIDNLNILFNIKNILHYGYPLYISLVIYNIREQLLNLIIVNNVTNELIGNFSSVKNIMQIILMIIIVIQTTLFQAFSELQYSINKYIITEIYNKSIKYVSLTILPVVSIFIFYSKNIIELLYGQKYYYSDIYLSYYMIIFAILPFGYYINDSLLNSQGYTGIIFYKSIINFLISIILAIYTIPIYGINGLIFTSILSIFISNTYILYKIKHIFEFNFNYKEKFKILFSSIIPGFLSINIINFLNLYNSLYNIVVGAFIYAIIYLFLCYYLKIINNEDFLFIKNNLYRIKK